MIVQLLSMFAKQISNSVYLQYCIMYNVYAVYLSCKYASRSRAAYFLNGEAEKRRQFFVFNFASSLFVLLSVNIEIFTLSD